MAITPTVVGESGPLSSLPPVPCLDLSLDALYREHADHLREFCARRLRNSADAEDACHETLLRAAKAGERFRGDASLRWWLFVIARNVCADIASRGTREVPVEEPERAVAYATVRPAADRGTERTAVSAEEEAERRARVHLVHAGLAGLAPRDRVYLVLRHLAGRSYQEIGRFDGASEGAVRTRLTRARRRLRDNVVTLAERERLWPVPAMLLAPLGRLRARWDAARTRARDQILFDLGGSAGTSLASIGVLLGPSAVQAATAVIATAGLALAPTAARPSPATPAPLAARTAAVAAELAPPDSGEIASAGSGMGGPAEPGPSPAPLPPPPSQGPPDATTPPAPRVESDVDDMAAEPVQRRGPDDDDPGYETTPTHTSVDRDGDGDKEVELPPVSAGLGCADSEHQGTVTALLCDAAEPLP